MIALNIGVMTVSQLRKHLRGLDKDAEIILAIEIPAVDVEDHFAVEHPASRVTVRPDNKVQIGDEFN